MYSKTLRQLTCFVVLAISTSSLLGCAKFLNGNSKNLDSKTIHIDASDFSCFGPMGGQLKDYFEDKASLEDTRAIFSCASHALEAFNGYAVGASSDQFTSEELRGFLNRYLTLKTQIPSEFMGAIMKIKVFFIGGSATSLTRGEIQSARHLLDFLSDQAVALRGHWQYLLFKMDPRDVNEVTVETNQVALSSVLQNILNHSHAGAARYTWVDLSDFIQQMSTYMGSTQLIENVVKYLPMADAVRALFLGNTDDMASLADFRDAGDWTAQAFGVFARYFYLLNKMDIKNVETWSNVIDFASQCLHLIQTSPQMTAHRLLPSADVDHVIDEVYKAHVLTWAISQDTVKDLYRQIFGHILRSHESQAPMAYQIQGIEFENIKTLLYEFKAWQTAEMSLIEAYKDTTEMPFVEVVRRIRAQPRQEIFATAGVTADQEPRLKIAYQEWLNTISARHPVIFNPDFSLKMYNGAENANIDIRGMSYVNAIRTVCRLFLTGYGLPMGEDASQYQMEERGIQNWNNDFLGIIHAMKFEDPRSTTSSQDMFDQARYFSYDGTGKKLLTFPVLMQEMSMMISGGMGIADRLMKKVGDDGCFLNELDAGFQKPIIMTSCLKESLKHRLPEVMQNLPHLLAEIQSQKIPYDEFFDELVVIGLIPQSRPGKTEYGELRQMTVVLHYLESLMWVYDADPVDQQFNKAELLNIFPRFKELIGSFLPRSMHPPEPRQAPLEAPTRWSVIEDMLRRQSGLESIENGFFNLRNLLGSKLEETAFLYVAYNGEIPDTKTLGAEIKSVKKLIKFAYKEHHTDLGSVGRRNFLKVITLIKLQTNGNLSAITETPNKAMTSSETAEAQNQQADQQAQ